MTKRQYSELEIEYRKARHRLNERVRYWTKKGYTFEKPNIVPKSSTKGMQSMTIASYIDYMKYLTKTELLKRTTDKRPQTSPTEDRSYQILIEVFRNEVVKIDGSLMHDTVEGIIEEAIVTYGERVFAERLQNYANEVIQAIELAGHSKQEEAERGLAWLFAVIRQAFSDITLDPRELGEYTDFFPDEIYEVE